MKKSPIAEFKESDVREVRLTLMGIVDEKCKHCGNSNPSNNKDKIEASKAILRSHHQLQADRTVEPSKDKVSPLSTEKEKEILDRVERLLDDSGRTPVS